MGLTVDELIEKLKKFPSHCIVHAWSEGCEEDGIDAPIVDAVRITGYERFVFLEIE